MYEGDRSHQHLQQNHNFPQVFYQFEFEQEILAKKKIKGFVQVGSSAEYGSQKHRK